MHQLWPNSQDGGASAALSDVELERLYDYPSELTRAWVQVNFVSSADGAVALGEHSEGLSHPADKRIFLLGRDLADVVLVGAGTAHAEQYRGARTSAAKRERRSARGLAEVPPVAVVSGRCSIEADSPLFTDTSVSPMVVTTRTAPASRIAAVADAGAEVIVAGEHSVDLAVTLDELAARGLYRVNCEGGPHLFASLIAEDLVDQLCLTVAPLLAGAGADRIASGRRSTGKRQLELASILHEDGFTMFRYRRSLDPTQRDERAE